MGFSIRLAPGIRVRASSRGLRASIGPRAARVHVGAGRPGFSTGAGPVGYSTSLGGSRRGSPARSTGSTTRSLAASTKAAEAHAAATAIQEILGIHREEFRSATRPVAAPVDVPPLAALRQRHRKAALAGVGLFAFRRRAEARRRAGVAAEAERAGLAVEADHARRERQSDLDAGWARLVANEPADVMTALAQAFEDNEAMAAPLGADREGVASVVVEVPDPDLIPERMPGVTDAGNLSLRRITNRQRNDLYAEMVCGYLLVTVKEAFAVAPGLAAVSAIAVRRAPADAYGRRRPEAVLAASFTRRSLEGVRWGEASAVSVLDSASTDRVFRRKGAAAELQPLDVTAHPDVANALEAIDLDVTDA